MQNNKIAQIVYRTIYITLGFIGIIGSFGYFNRSFNQDFYVMYTNLSNYFCIGVTYNILLAKDKTISDYFFSISNLIMHLILPLMFLVDWILFNNHNNAKWYYPFLSTILPLIYVAFILIRALILGNSYSGTLYPYFFLNVERLGLGGVTLWVIILVVFFVALGYILFMFDRFKTIKEKLKRNKK